MFNKSSQRFYVTNKLKEKLKLETIRIGKLTINIFGNDKSELIEFHIV